MIPIKSEDDHPTWQEPSVLRWGLSTMMVRFAATVQVICLFSFLLNCGIIQVDASSSSIDSIPETQPYRTSYHFQPSHNWMNGIVFTNIFFNSVLLKFTEIVSNSFISASFDILCWGINSVLLKFTEIASNSFISASFDMLCWGNLQFESPDPNGPMYYKGVYHLFYQYNPREAKFGDGMIWAHSVSYDLINWIHLNNAIEPSQPSDISSCWSGSVTILPGDKPVILYTGIEANKNQVQNLATPKNLSDPFLREWIKYPHNPIMNPPIGVELDNFRDPSTAWLGKDGKWRVVMGAQNGDEGKVILGQTEDFVNWTVDANPFYLSENTGVVECPDFYPVSVEGTNGVDTSEENPNVRHVLKIGYFRNPHDFYFLGKYLSDQNSFIPDTKFTGTSLDLRYDYGKFYGSKTFFDHAKNRRIIWGWVNESDTLQDDLDKGWAGLQSIPRQVWLDKSGKRLVQWPVEEVEKLRKGQISITGEELVSKSLLEVSGITASQADVEVLFELPEIENAEGIDPIKVDPQMLCSEEYASQNGIIGPFGLSALASEDQTEQTAIFFRIYKAPDRYIGVMCSDQSRSSLRKDLDKTTYGSFFDVDPKIRTISLRTLIDHSIIESFGEGGRVCITSRVYPSLAIHENAHLYVFNNGSQSVTVSKLDAWSMGKAAIGHQDPISCF